MREASATSGETAAGRSATAKVRGRAGCVLAVAACLLAIYPTAARQVEKHRAARRLATLETRVTGPLCTPPAALDTAISARIQRLGPLLASWQTVGGCGAGGGGAAGAVKWIGRNTRGGLFQLLCQSNYVRMPNDNDLNDGGYTLTTTTQLGRELSEDLSVGIIIPMLYKYYRNYGELTTNPSDVSNGGLGDINLVMTKRLGPINATSITVGLAFPTGEHAGIHRGSYLTQEKQLGIGNYNGSIIVDHVIDEVWGLLLVGGTAAHRGGQNELGNYRAPTASLYGHAGYFLGPFVAAGGLTASAFTAKDRDQGIKQNVPIGIAAASASIEWSNDYLAILAGASLPYGLMEWGGPVRRQPMTFSVGVSMSPF